MFAVGCFVTAVICLISTYSRRLKQLICQKFSRAAFVNEAPDTDRKRINSESIAE